MKKGVEHFEMCVQFALQLFQRHVAHKLKKEKYLSMQMIEESILDHHTTAMDFFRDFQPCQAVYPGTSTPVDQELEFVGEGGEILCLEHRRTHRALHRTCVKVIPQAVGVWGRIMRTWKRFTRMGMNEVWRGEFEFDEEVFNAIMAEETFIDGVKGFIDMPTGDKAKSLSKLILDEREMLANFYFRRCLNCYCSLANVEDMTLHQVLD